MPHFRQTVVFFLLLLLAPLSFGDPLRLSGGQKTYEVTQHTRYLKDESSSLTIEAIVANESWSPVTSTTVNFNYSSATYWLIIDIEQNTNMRRWTLDVGWPFIDYLDIYQAQKQKDGTHQIISKASLGDMQKLKRPNKDIKHTFLFEEGQSYSLVLRVQSKSVLFLPMKLSEATYIHDIYEWKLFAQGAMIGILVVMAFYNLLIYTKVREPQYVAYFFLVISNCFFQAAIIGVFKYCAPMSWLSEQSYIFFANCAFIFANIFTYHFLKLEKKFPAAYKFFYWFTVFWIFTTAASAFFEERFFPVFTFPATFVNCAIALWVPAKLWREGHVEARYFLVAWSAMIIGTIFFTMYMLGVAPDTFITRYGQQIGSVIETVLISLSLGKQIEIERSAKIAAQLREKLAYIEVNKMLEAQVTSKTLELRAALDNIERMYRKVEQSSKTDALTGLFNRGEFNYRIDVEWRRAEREVQPLALIMMDIDFFKKVNDTYGHQAGDDCLKHVAFIVRGNARRAADCACRYGGEEFAVILPNTTLKDAEFVAERMRSEIEASSYTSGDNELRCTSSLGVASMVPSRDFECKDLIKVADDLLYKAKQSGRNCVKSK